MIPIPELDDFAVAFGGDALAILPPVADIPEEFRRNHNPSRWCRVVDDWFFCGLKNAAWTPKPGVDKTKALRALKACMGSFDPSHEHKTAGCAYLLSEWFENVTYEKAKELR